MRRWRGSAGDVQRTVLVIVVAVIAIAILVGLRRSAGDRPTAGSSAAPAGSAETPDRVAEPAAARANTGSAPPAPGGRVKYTFRFD